MIKRIQDMDVTNKRVLLRCDFNVPVKEGKILDDSKIIASLQTIEYLIKKGSKVIILSHFGKVKTEADKETNTLAPVADRLQELLNKPVIFSKQPRSLYLEAKIDSMQPGDVILLENTRFEDVPNKLESECDPQLSMYWASLADVFCLDAFGSAHRKHASTYGVAEYLPNCIGFLVQQEIEMLDKYVLQGEHPFTIVMGGAKVEDKVSLIEALLPKCDHLLVTGGIANSLLYTLGFNVGSSLCTKDPEIIARLKTILVQNKNKIVLPTDVIVGRSYEASYIKHINYTEITNDDIIGDIGMNTVNEFTKIINESQTVFVNGTAGKYEENEYATGTRELLTNIANAKCKKVAGGGDGVSAIKKFKLGEKFTYLSTGGGATLEYIINNGHLPAIDNIETVEEL
jgi:phosphoglycerate kinase